MLHKIFFDENGIVNEILKNMGFQTGEKEPSIENVPFYRGVKNRIKELGVFEENARLERKVLSHLLNYIDEACKEPKKPEAPKEPEKSQSPEPPKEPEIPAEAKAPEPPAPEKPAEAETPPLSQEKIDTESFIEPVNPRLRVLENGAKNAIENLEKAPLTEHFKDVKRVYELLKLAHRPTSGLTEMERLAKLEAAIGEAHSFLQSSRLATRFNVLKDVKKIMEDAMDKKAQI
ncbi:MAG: hypothetical protein PHH77_09730 [Victivallaceae bacterium]|nr:hypothetical protein [Victivallaceae bacterium]